MVLGDSECWNLMEPDFLKKIILPVLNKNGLKWLKNKFFEKIYH